MTWTVEAAAFIKIKRLILCVFQSINVSSCPWILGLPYEFLENKKLVVPAHAGT
jgi:hypothetical protein